MAYVNSRPESGLLYQMKSCFQICICCKFADGELSGFLVISQWIPFFGSPKPSQKSRMLKFFLFNLVTWLSFSHKMESCLQMATRIMIRILLQRRRIVRSYDNYWHKQFTGYSASHLVLYDGYHNFRNFLGKLEK